MEVVKDIKAGNGVPKVTGVKEDTGVKGSEKAVDINKITEEDLSNLRQIFTWALTVTTKDRAILASIIAFEDSLFKKLKF